MAARSYSDAAYPEPWQILGVRLRPLSLGHYLKLQQLGCAFIADDTKTATLGDLLLGVAVCSMSSDPDPTKDEFWCWWLRPARFNLWAWLFRKQNTTPAEKEIVQWGRMCRKGFDFAEKVQLFAEYIKAHSKFPICVPTRNSGESTSDSGAHWSHAVIAGLVAHCGYTQQEAYNVPMSKALQDYCKAAEDSGSVRMASPEEIAAFEAQLGGANGA